MEGISGKVHFYWMPQNVRGLPMVRASFVKAPSERLAPSWVHRPRCTLSLDAHQHPQSLRSPRLGAPGTSFLVGDPAPARQGLSDREWAHFCQVSTSGPSSAQEGPQPICPLVQYLTLVRATQRNAKNKNKTPTKKLSKQKSQANKKPKTQEREFLSAKRQHLQSPSHTEHISGHTQWHDPDDRDNRS